MLCTTTSMRPSCAARSNSASTCCSSRASIGTVTQRMPAAASSVSSAMSFVPAPLPSEPPPASLRAATTKKPSSPNARQRALPIPGPAPTTIATDASADDEGRRECPANTAVRAAALLSAPLRSPMWPQRVWLSVFSRGMAIEKSIRIMAVLSKCGSSDRAVRRRMLRAGAKAMRVKVFVKVFRVVVAALRCGGRPIHGGGEEEGAARHCGEVGRGHVDEELHAVSARRARLLLSRLRRVFLRVKFDA
mmetsp:Transcript_1646/g.6045  ORF Transcript_1646/g.6045 Transcript_1646/m.6045 type:complete len:248 (+) Transcript_1646:531-1274(+)